MRIAYALVLLATGCQPSTVAPAENGNAAARDDSHWIALRRTRCYGPCPGYSVKLFADGRSSWVGHDNVAKIGPASGTVDRRAVIELLRELEEIDLSGVPPDMPKGADCATDASSAVITAADGARTIRAFHYYGCEGSVLDRLSQIENGIDRGIEPRRIVTWVLEGEDAIDPAGWSHGALVVETEPLSCLVVASR
jgi:hypothetical protein